jgi:hypothetical protein
MCSVNEHNRARRRVRDPLLATTGPPSLKAAQEKLERERADAMEAGEEVTAKVEVDLATKPCTRSEHERPAVLARHPRSSHQAIRRTTAPGTKLSPEASSLDRRQPATRGMPHPLSVSTPSGCLTASSCPVPISVLITDA